LEHVFFADKYFGYDDGIYAACRTLEILDKTGQKLSDLMDIFPQRLSSPEIKLECSDENKFEVVEKLKSFFQSSGKFKKIITIDGVRVEVSDTGWFLIRTSNTSPYLSIRFEGKDEKELKFLANEVYLSLSQFPEVKLDLLKKLIG
jgi:phosphomannomutase